MARVLLTGTPERLAPVAERLMADGHAVRCAVPGGTAVAAGAESVDASPTLPGGIVAQLDGVTVAAWLLGDEAWSEPDLHGEKLATMLHRVVDTGVRGFIYEFPSGYDGAGERSDSGQVQLRHAHETWRIPVAMVYAGVGDDSQGAEQLAAEVSQAVGELLGA
jgi:hypothetical protein